MHHGRQGLRQPLALLHRGHLLQLGPHPLVNRHGRPQVALRAKFAATAAEKIHRRVNRKGVLYAATKVGGVIVLKGGDVVKDVNGVRVATAEPGSSMADFLSISTMATIMAIVVGYVAGMKKLEVAIGAYGIVSAANSTKYF